jgi:glycosyltransferase involved in cell wall biosynthesis
MKVGWLVPNSTYADDPYVHTFGSTIDMLQEEHELIYRPPDYTFRSEAWQKDMLKEMLLSCDVLLGVVDVDLALQLRQEINKNIPYCSFMLGWMPRGNTTMMKRYHLFRTTDVLLVNCTGDLEIANNFFENAQTRLLPLPFRESNFYPMDDASKQALRATLGFDSEDKILFYPGRITLEKNVHSILRIFSVIQKLIPNTRLVVAGRPHNIPFLEFGAFSINISNTMKRVVSNLGIDEDKVTFIGHRGKADLCGLYNIADVVINMTLNHDENFGFSQIEAMACGTPVIGTNWGGLKDTITEGETGYKASTMVTSSGIKLNWWEAVNKIVSLLHNKSERQQLREQCVTIAHNKYSLFRYRENLRSILAGCREKAQDVGEPLKATEFAQQYWASPFQLYKELITPYTGRSQDSVVVDQLPKANQVICLATPLIKVGEESFEINDPIFPLRITIPAEHKEVICAVIEVMKEEPAITVERLTKNHLAGLARIQDALEWMIEAGLILRGGLENGVLPARSIGSQMSLPLFSIQTVNSSSDVAALR